APPRPRVSRLERAALPSRRTTRRGVRVSAPGAQLDRANPGASRASRHERRSPCAQDSFRGALVLAGYSAGQASQGRARVSGPASLCTWHPFGTSVRRSDCASAQRVRATARSWSPLGRSLDPAPSSITRYLPSGLGPGGVCVSNSPVRTSVTARSTLSAGAPVLSVMTRPIIRNTAVQATPPGSSQLASTSSVAIVAMCAADLGWITGPCSWRHLSAYLEADLVAAGRGRLMLPRPPVV